MNLTNPCEVRAIMESHGLQFQKQFGQNFLISAAIPARIAEQAGECVLEIGPGIGTLTRELCARAQQVECVEIDRGLIPVLAETLADFDNVRVTNADIMQLDIAEFVRDRFGGRRITVCANLPYYITTPVIMALLESGAPIDRITVMVQKEVAGRLAAAPGSSEYGAVTAAVAWYGCAERLFDVPAGCFVPRPKVDSAVIRITLGCGARERVGCCDERLMLRLISAAFGMRRKTLLNALGSSFSHFSKEELAKIIESAGISPTVRGERLSVAEYAHLADVMAECTKNEG